MSNSDELARMLARLTEYRTEIEKALGPNRVLEDLIKATQPATSQWLRGIDLGNITRATQPMAHLTAASQMEIAIERQHRILNEVARFNDLKQVTQRHSFFENITAPYDALRKVIRSQAEVLESSCSLAGLKSIESSFSRLYQSMQAWDAASIGLTDRLHNIGLLARQGLSQPGYSRSLAFMLPSCSIPLSVWPLTPLLESQPDCAAASI